MLNIVNKERAVAGNRLSAPGFQLSARQLIGPRGRLCRYAQLMRRLPGEQIDPAPAGSAADRVEKEQGEDEIVAAQFGRL